MIITYAIGDIHGRHALLLAMLARIEDHAGGRRHSFVFLGDYIDRGPESAAVIATLRALQKRLSDGVVCLMGNHEWLLLVARADPTREDWWLDNGGGATLDSYGVASARQMPADDVAWIEGLPIDHADHRRYYVHAG